MSHDYAINVIIVTCMVWFIMVCYVGTSLLYDLNGISVHKLEQWLKCPNINIITFSNFHRSFSHHKERSEEIPVP